MRTTDRGIEGQRLNFTRGQRRSAFGVGEASRFSSSTPTRRYADTPTRFSRTPGGLSRVPCLANKSIAFCYHLVRMFEKVAPDTSWFNQVRKRPSKRLDGQPTIVSARLDGSKGGREVDVTAPGYSTVVVCHMNMRYLCRIF